MTPASTSFIGSRLGYRRELDGLRGLAVTLVVLFHATWLNGGFLGVDIFFVLSGFLITTLLLEEQDQRGGISLARFYLRRALRLLPALFVMLAGYSAAVLVLQQDVAVRLQSAALSSVYIANVALAFRWDFASELVPLWSLATEEQFYLLWPPALVWLLKRRLRLDTILWLLLGIVALIALVRAALVIRGIWIERVQYGPDLRMDAILIGCAASIVFVRGHLARRRRLLRALGILGICIVASMATLTPHAEVRVLYVFLITIFAGATAAALLGALYGVFPLVVRVLRTLPLVFLGGVSYAWYLWHALFLSVAHVDAVRERFGGMRARLVAIAASLIVAIASTYLVERPFLRLKDRVSRVEPHSRFAVAAER